MTVSPVLRKFSALYAIGRFITVFTTVRHLSLPWATSIQSTPSYPVSIIFILILSSHISLSRPSNVVPSVFPHHHNLCAALPHALYPTSISIFLIWFSIFGEDHKSWSHSKNILIQSPVTSSLLVSTISLSTLFLNTLSLCSSLHKTDQVSHP